MRLDLLPAPVLALSGWSGAGKTTLLEQAIRQLAGSGLRVAVLKHDAHGVQLDQEGKDSHRLFCAGATVALRAPEQSFLRTHAGTEGLERTLASLATSHDLVLVEGHKDTPLPKVWLAHPNGSPVPANIANVRAFLPWGGERLEPFLSLIAQILQEHFAARPLLGGVVLGGASARMGRPKHLLRLRGRTLGERVRRALAAHVSTVVMLGQAPKMPGGASLPDAAGVDGPLGGILAALRWHPTAAWLIAACDMPALTADALAWVLAQRRPGVWAIIPRHAGGRLEPLGAVWEPQIGPVLEDLVRGGRTAPRLAAEHRKVLTPLLPTELAAAYTNLNTPKELAAWRRRETRRPGRRPAPRSGSNSPGDR